MKKHLAVLLIAIMAVSVLSTAGVVAGASGSAVNPTITPISPQQAIDPVQGNSPNPQPTNAPGPGALVQAKLQVSPLVILPQTKQTIRVTILYDKKSFDPLAYSSESFNFGRTGTAADAAPIGYSVSDVNHDGYKDLTLVFNAKDTGLKIGQRGKLTGTITLPRICTMNCIKPIDTLTKLNPSKFPSGCIGPICPDYVTMPIRVTGTASTLVL